MPEDDATDLLELERLELAHERAILEREKLEHARALKSSTRDGWRLGAAWTAAIFPAFAAVAAVWIAVQQIDADGKNADRRAQAELEQQRERDRSELRLAAINVVLNAPTCDAAEARATLAKSVLRDVLPEDFVDQVRGVRVVAFAELRPAYIWDNTKIAGYGGLFKRSRKGQQAAADARRQYEQALAKAREDHELACDELEG